MFVRIFKEDENFNDILIQQNGIEEENTSYHPSKNTKELYATWNHILGKVEVTYDDKYNYPNEREELAKLLLFKDANELNEFLKTQLNIESGDCFYCYINFYLVNDGKIT
jgi:hypothetical protein